MRVKLSNDLKAELKSLDRNGLNSFKEFIRESTKAKDINDLLYNSRVSLSMVEKRNNTYLARVTSRLRVVFDLDEENTRNKVMKILDVIDVTR